MMNNARTFLRATSFSLCLALGIACGDDVGPEDTGVVVDTGVVPTDAGQIAGDAAVTDTGVVADAGSPDLGTPADAGGPIDAGEPVDLGTPVDAGEPADAGAEDAGQAAVTFTEVFDSILSVSCSCHGGASHQTGLTMQNRAAAYANLVEAATTSGSCTNLPRVDPGDADNSSLYRRITGTSCGTSMPFGSTLSAPNAAKIQAWINAGAADD